MCSFPPARTPSILGISFDGLAISGIVNEFLNAAFVLRDGRHRVLLDLGFEIKTGKTRNLGSAYLPSWVLPIRCIGDVYPREYSPELARHVRDLVIAGTSIKDVGTFDNIVRELASSLVRMFFRENVDTLLIENGTLPENPLFTEALLLAISEHGTHQHLGKYVLWRDHDMMWSSEPNRYGNVPYAGVRKPEANKHVHYAVTTEWMRQRMLAWAPTITCSVLPCRFFSPLQNSRPSGKVRKHYGIPWHDFLIARCTRIMPQKSIERDIRLLREIQSRLIACGDPRRAFLVVSGPIDEHPEEYVRLRCLSQEMAVADHVIWADGLLPFHAYTQDANTAQSRFSIRDLLAEADLSSFLTTFDYEGFGMPPGEAMAMGVPFITTTYELYDEIYGVKGVIAPLLPIDHASSSGDPLPEPFIAATMRALTDVGYRSQVTNHNFEVVRKFFSLDALEGELRALFAMVF